MKFFTEYNGTYVEFTPDKPIDSKNFYSKVFRNIKYPPIAMENAIQGTVLVTCVVEPGRFRMARDRMEAEFVAADSELAALFPTDLPRIIVSHTRPEPMTGVLRRIDRGPKATRFLGFSNRGGTLDTAGLLFANATTWAHIVHQGCEVMAIDIAPRLSMGELKAVEFDGDPQMIMTPPEE